MFYMIYSRLNTNTVSKDSYLFINVAHFSNTNSQNTFGLVICYSNIISTTLPHLLYITYNDYFNHNYLLYVKSYTIIAWSCSEKYFPPLFLLVLFISLYFKGLNSNYLKLLWSCLFANIYTITIDKKFAFVIDYSKMFFVLFNIMKLSKLSIFYLNKVAYFYLLLLCFDD